MPKLMRPPVRIWFPLKADQRAVTALENGMIAAAVVTIGLAGFNVIGDDVAAKFSIVKNAMDPAAATTTTASPPPTHRYDD
jgi:Flp pilus assembly pilin Flp